MIHRLRLKEKIILCWIIFMVDVGHVWEYIIALKIVEILKLKGLINLEISKYKSC
jgi:hypothetical protein